MNPDVRHTKSQLQKIRETRAAAQYRRLDAASIVHTCEVLAKRMRERFPSAGLLGVATDLVSVANDTSRIANRLAGPMPVWRLISVALTAGLIGILVVIGRNVRVSWHVGDAVQLVQGLESFVNCLVFAGIAVYFAFSIETRRKRTMALRFIAQLRSLAHVVDMHQLDKDPDRYDPAYKPTASSPKPDMTPAQLTRYLDYCSEMLAMLGKMAALCVQRFEDTATLAAVDELENLTAGLSRKVWEKIMILDRMLAVGPAPVEPPVATPAIDVKG